MKNIQVIDGAENCTYDIFSVSDGDFKVIFPNSTEIAFIDEVIKTNKKSIIGPIFKKMWKRRVPKKNVNGIHGTLFYELSFKKKYYPNRKDDDSCTYKII